MATIPPVAPGGNGASTWAPKSSSVPRGDWGRGGEPGSAFRGMSKAKTAPRGGRGGGRGVRSGGGRGGSAAPGDDGSSKPADTAKDIVVAAVSGPTPIQALTPVPVSAPAQPTANKAATRPRTSSRRLSDQRSSRRVASLVIDPPSASSPTVSTSSSSTRPPARRRRSQTQPKALPVAPVKQSISVEATLPALVESKPTLVSKDMPPHLVPAEVPLFDIRHDIEALVERVRAVAMDRPHTPGSHIDWAGDDDDSLPDLDDWGVTSSSLTDHSSDRDKGTVISPILEDSLRSLPNLGEPSVSSAEESSVDEAEHPGISPEVYEEKPPASTPRPAVIVREDTIRAKPSALGPHKSESEPMALAASTQSQSAAVEPSSDKQKDLSSIKSSIETAERSYTKAPAKLPMHPSLPPKPVAALDSLQQRRPPRNAHTTGPMKPAMPKSPVDERPVENGSTPSIHVPARVNSSVSQQFPVKDPSPERNIVTSTHSSISSSASAPSHLSSRSLPNTHASFPAHNRSHTVGRPSTLRPPNIVDTSHHSRNHSSPSIGSGTATAPARTVHARPVITGEAISRLARTLGGAMPKREIASVAARVD